MGIQDQLDSPEGNLYLALLHVRDSCLQNLSPDESQIFSQLVSILHIEGDTSQALLNKVSEVATNCPKSIEAYERYKRQWLALQKS